MAGAILFWGHAPTGLFFLKGPVQWVRYDYLCWVIMRAKCICFSRMLLWKIRYDLSLLFWPFQLAGSTSLSWLGWWEISSWVIESSPMGLVGHHYAKGSIGCKWFWVFWSDSWDSQRLSWWFILAYSFLGLLDFALTVPRRCIFTLSPIVRGGTIALYFGAFPRIRSQGWHCTWGHRCWFDRYGWFFFLRFRRLLVERYPSETTWWLLDCFLVAVLWLGLYTFNAILSFYLVLWMLSPALSGS